MQADAVAHPDPSYRARIIRSFDMRYAEGPSENWDRPDSVLAASALNHFLEYLVVVQDNANWLALIDGDDGVHALPLPAGPDGARVFGKDRGNKHEKFDLEACITVPGQDGEELVGFGSGSHRGREWLLRLHRQPLATARLSSRAVHAGRGIDFQASFFDVTDFYERMRATERFAGARLNIEGAVTLDDDRIMLFQRGNARPTGQVPAVDATAELSWAQLAAHLEDPEAVGPPPLSRIRRYDLGSLDGVRLTFSDAEALSDGRILYSASAECRETDRIAGSVLGVIQPDGSVRYGEVVDEDGQPFHGKIEGLSRSRRAPRRVHFVIDDDDETLPSRLFEAELSDAFLAAA